MSHQDSKTSAALIVGIIALVLSVYATIAVTQMGRQAEEMSAQMADKPGTPSVVENLDEDLEQQMVQVIENFIAGAYIKPIDLDEGSGIVKGEEDAPVTIIEFSDYQCPFCKKYFDETLSQIQEEYIDTGKVKYVFRDFPLSIHPQAIPAANAARCVLEEGDLDDYWAYHDILFQNQAKLGEDDLKAYAAEIRGINAEQVAKCIDEKRFVNDVQADFAAGQQAGVSGTPAFFINGRMLQPAGAQPFSTFEAAIEKALTEGGQE